jgi:hypothetical protein
MSDDTNRQKLFAKSCIAGMFAAAAWLLLFTKPGTDIAFNLIVVWFVSWWFIYWLLSNND